jgi:iron complex transport system ATP-binding protein
MGLLPHRSRFEPLGDADLDRARTVMQEAGVWDFAGKNVAELSGGQAQRVILARALLQVFPDVNSGLSKRSAAPRQPLLLLDEAMSELDIAARIDMMNLIRTQVTECGLTVLGIHHDLHTAYRFADRVIALHNGSIAADGSPAEVFTGDFFRTVFSVKAEIIAGKGFLVG